MRTKSLIGSTLVGVLFLLTLRIVNTAAQERPQVQTERRAATPAGAARETTRLVREIRHELLTLPYYGVFDWLEGQVQPDGIVVLRGQVVRPTTKSDAEARVREIEGVEKVVDEIKVLSVSPNDDRLRLALYRTIFNDNSPLFRYALGSNPTIHIIVDNGRAALKGVVNSESDKQLAYSRASAVPGVFEIKNELIVEGSAER